MQSRYDKYESGSSDYDERPEIVFSTYAEIEAEVESVFGTTGGEWGQSFAVRWDDIEVVDGCLYADPEKEKYKLFSWADANDLSPAEQYDRGRDPSAEDAPDFIRKDYASTTKEYELVGARVAPLEDDGETVVESSSRVRDVSFVGDGDVELGDFEELGGDFIQFGSAISWHSGSTDYGPSIVSQSIAETLSKYGENAVTSTDDIFDWFVDDTKEDVLREDLSGRRVRFLTVTKPGDEYNYNVPVVEDVETGEEIRPNNRTSGGDTGNSDGGDIGDSDAVQEAAELDEQAYPEPIADFISSGDRLDLTEERARNLLDDLIGDSDNALTSEMVTDNGGREVLVNQVV